MIYICQVLTFYFIKNYNEAMKKCQSMIGPAKTEYNDLCTKI
jgi:hypothetical protein